MDDIEGLQPFPAEPEDPGIPGERTVAAARREIKRLHPVFVTSPPFGRPSNGLGEIRRSCDTQIRGQYGYRMTPSRKAARQGPHLNCGSSAVEKRIIGLRDFQDTTRRSRPATRIIRAVRDRRIANSRT